MLSGRDQRRIVESTFPMKIPSGYVAAFGLCGFTSSAVSLPYLTLPYLTCLLSHKRKSSQAHSQVVERLKKEPLRLPSTMYDVSATRLSALSALSARLKSGHPQDQVVIAKRSALSKRTRTVIATGCSVERRTHSSFLLCEEPPARLPRVPRESARVAGA